MIYHLPDRASDLKYLLALQIKLLAQGKWATTNVELCIVILSSSNIFNQTWPEVGPGLSYIQPY